MVKPPPLETDQKPCNIARRISDVVTVPINDHRVPRTQDNVRGVIVAMAGARIRLAECQPSGLQSVQQLPSLGR